ncbi:MAG: RidA family protein [Pseudomonadota bacterium]
MIETQRISSGSPFEDQFGFCRAIRVGPHIHVAGTGPIEDDGQSTQGDISAQARRCFTLIEHSLGELGGGLKDVVRTRMYLTDISEQELAGAVHAEFFGDIRPVATMVGVASLCRPEWRIEVEAEAILTNDLANNMESNS